MKKNILISILLCFTLVLGFVPFSNTKTNFSAVSAFESFEQSFISEIQNDDYSSIEIEKNTTLSQLKQKMNICENNNISALSNQILTKNQIVEFCSENDFVLKEEEDCYQIRNKFSLNRLIVYENISSDYGAKKVLAYKDFKILCFNNPQETKKAYQTMANEYIDVAIDSVVTADSEEIVTAQKTINNWGTSAIDLSSYTNYNTTQQIVVAVLDTGINTAHEMFTDRLLYSNGKIVGFSYCASDYSYSKNNMYFSSSDNSKLSFEDDYGHGSHVAGIICQLTPTNVKILPLKVLNNKGEGSMTNVVTALNRVNEIYSSSYKIACTNLSLGGEVTTDFSGLKSNFDNAFKNLMNKNILNIVAAGNENKSTDKCMPAACDETAIVVSALTYITNSSNTKITGYQFDNTYSNYGSSVDICAPGSYIYSAYKVSSDSSSNANQYAQLSGTSMATPFVSGCVALLCLDNDYYSSTSDPTYTASEIQTRIFDNAVDYGASGKDVLYGYGVLSLTNISVKGDISYTASDATFTYDGSYHNISINVTKPTNYTIKYSLSNDSNYTITDTTSNSSFKNATNGSMAVYYQISASNYNTVTGVNYLTINKRNLTYTLENQTSTYGNSSHLNSSKLKLTSGSVVSGDNLNLKLTTDATQTSNCGTYNINLTYSNSNYNISADSATLTINQRPINIKIDNSSSIYGESYTPSNNNYTISSGTVISGDDLGIELDYSQIDYSTANTYAVTLKTYTNTNYIVTATTGTHTVQQRPISITLQDQTSVYGEEINLSQTAYTISSGNIVNDDNLNINLSTSATKSSNANNYKITAIANNSNYDITFSSANYIITKRDITISTQNQTFTYGNVSIDQTKYTIDAGSFVFDDINKLSLTSNANNTADVGSYPIVVTLNSNNYNLTQNNGNATIDKRTLKITISVNDVYYGDVLTLNNSQYEITVGSVVNGDNIEIELTSNYDKTNKKYIVYATSLNNNYEIIILNNEINVLKRPISVSINQKSIYGNEVNLDAEDFKVVKGSIVYNDNLNLNIYTDATNLSTVGKYQIYLSSANENYNVTLTNSYLTITPKTIYATLETQTSIYGDKIILDQTKYNFNTNQLVGSDSINFSLTTNATSKSNVGNYIISASVDNNNYNLSNCQGIYTITKRKVAIRVYNQTVENSFNLTFNGEDYDIMSGTVVNNDELNIVLHSTASKLSLAGNYDLTATYSNDNYDITFTEAKLTVEFSYVDVIIITVPVVVIGLIATIVVLVFVKRKNNSSKFYKKWMK